MTLAAAERLLSMLVERAPGVVTEASAAQALGRDVAAAQRTLAARGHVLQPVEGGWSLACGREHFDPVRFERQRVSRLGTPLEVWEHADSTQDLGRDGAARGAPEGSVWLAEEQGQGRARQGRRWQCAPHAGLLFSCLLRTSLAPTSRPTLLPLAIGVGVCEAVRASTGLDVRPKWPNDLLLGGEKVAGILIEARPSDAGCVVVGLGLNVQPGAVAKTNLPDSGDLGGGDREALLASLLAGLESRFTEWRARSFSGILSAWRALDVLPGRTVELRMADCVLRGRVLGITDEGLLRLAVGDGSVLELPAGEVHLQ